MKTPLTQISRASLRTHKTQNALTVLVMALAICLCVVLVTAYTSLMSALEEWPLSTYGEMHFTYMDARPGDLEQLLDELTIERYGTLRAVATVDDDAVGEAQPLVVGAMDTEAITLERVTMLEGRLPDGAGEIAMPESTLFRLGLDARVGDRIELWLRSMDGRLTRPESFTLVGIVNAYYQERGPYLWTNAFGDEDDFSIVMTDPEADTYYDALDQNWRLSHPQLIISQQDADAIVKNFGTERLSYPVLLASDADRKTELSQLAMRLYREGKFTHLLENKRGHDPAYSPQLPSINPGSIYRNLGQVLFVMTIGLLVALAVGGGIGAAFSVRLLHKRRQLGMLHAVGASRMQAAQIALGESVPLMLCALPIGLLLGVGLSIAGVRLLETILIQALPRAFDPALTAVCMGISALVMLYFAARPTLKLYKLSPIEAMKQLQPRAKGKKPRRYSAPALVSLAACIALAVFGPTLLQSYQRYYTLALARDYDIVTLFADSTHYIEKETPIDNEVPSDASYGPPEAQIAKIAAMDEALNVSTERVYTGGMLMLADAQYGEYAKYSKLWGREDLDYVSQKVEECRAAAERFNLPKDRRLWAESFGAEVRGINTEGLRAFEDSLLDGAINIDKLQSGEEVLIGAPPLYFLDFEEGGWSIHYGTVNERTMDHTHKIENDSFRVGDEISFVTRYQEDPDNIILRTVRIGGILDTRPGILYLAESAFQSWGLKSPVSEVTVRLRYGDGYEAACRQLSIIAGQNNMDYSSSYEMSKGNLRVMRALMAMIIALLALLGSISIAQLIGSGINRLQGRTRELSLMRAVGMDIGAMRAMLYREAIQTGLCASVIGIAVGFALLVWAMLQEFMGNAYMLRAFSANWWAELMSLMPWWTMLASLLIPSVVHLLVARWYVRRMDGTSIIDGLRVVDA